MEWVETTGRTIEEAKEAALDELGVDEQDAEFEVLEEPKVGLFGRLRAEGRIRARVRPTTPRAKDDRRDRRRRTKTAADGAGAPGDPPTTEEPVAGRASKPRRTSSVASPEPAAGGAVGGDGARPADPAEIPGPQTSDGGPGRPRTNPSRRRGRAGARPAAALAGATVSSPDGVSAAPDDPSGASESLDDSTAPPGRTPSEVAGTDGQSSERPPGPARSRSRRRTPGGRGPAASSDEGIEVGEGTLMDVALDEQGKVAEQFLVGLLDSFGLPAQIAVTVPDDDTIDIQVTGDDLGLLIGPKGATLLSIQDLTRTVVQRKTSAGNGRIFIDVAGYRQKRNEALTRFAQKVAADVVASGTRVAMEPMSAPDRKTVHDAINDIDGVMTISEGEDAQRHVIVLPAGD
jgi:spoIIIJ-associated protein